ncbi:hypothetical protein ILYODFUR_028056 [Ilyodon furcidens]|uniref:Uncharacterized protein n=1 Tax=Ilyodon furcidens TaxID=33524 RepID=A0ABV0UWY1_9TELE
MAVLLALLLSAHDSLAVVDQNQLRTLIQQVLNIYKPSYPAKNQYNQHYMKTPMFSVVVSIPFNNKTKQYDISQLPDGTLVKKNILDCDVLTYPSSCQDVGEILVLKQALIYNCFLLIS